MRTFVIAVLAALPVLSGPPAMAAELFVTDAFARASLGSAPGGAYLTIHGGDETDRLVSASSPRAAAVSLHSMVMDGTVMRMRPLEGIAVPAGGVVQLAPGGMHLMLEGLTAPLRAGQTVPVVLRFEKAGERRVEVPVGTLGGTLGGTSGEAGPHAH